MTANSYEILRRALEAGALTGIRRHYKHAQTSPTEDAIMAEADRIVDAQLLEVSEVFFFPQQPTES